MFTTVWQILNMKWMKWPETKIMWICWNLLGKICEIKSGKLIFGGFEIFGTIVRLGIGNTSPTIFSMSECEYTLHSQSHTSLNINVLIFQKIYVLLSWILGSGEARSRKRLRFIEHVSHSSEWHHVAKTYSFIYSNFFACRGTRRPRNSNNRETRSRR